MKWPGAHNMVFTQRRGFVLGASLGLQIHSLRCRTLVCYAVDTASLATWFLFGKLFSVATLVGFGEKRCRKNLPLRQQQLDGRPSDPIRPTVFCPHLLGEPRLAVASEW